jgi:23S rRNA pseudouridine955/2504/2580 synthase
MSLQKFKNAIQFENDNYLVITKPGNISSLDERDGSRLSIKELAKQYNPELQLCHRLDKETSGALVMAKNAAAYRHLAIQFEKRTVSKVYHAVVHGQKQFDNVEINYPISVSIRRNVRIDTQEGKPSTTIVNTLQVFQKNTLLECRPITGRMHQIRIHLACVASPIVSDLLYGGKYLYLSEIKRKFKLKKGEEEQPLIARVALHSYSISFNDLDGKKLEISAKYPKDIRALLNQLEKNL